jgi:alpha-pyrone synthase
MAHIQAIGTAAPTEDAHPPFLDWAARQIADERQAKLFARMAARSGIARRGTVLPPGALTAQGGFYDDAHWPGTAARMARYAQAAPRLAAQAVAALGASFVPGAVTHLVLASCTGFIAPGIDQLLAVELGLPSTVERTLVGFMGCYAAVAALRVAHHIIRSDPAATVLVVSVELSTLHLQATGEVNALLAQLQFADGAAAALLTAEASGLALSDFFAATVPASSEQISWTIGDHGFSMHLAGAVPQTIAKALGDPAFAARLPWRAGEAVAAHAGGRTVLDAVGQALALPTTALTASRTVLREHGNMSSATLLFVLARMLADRQSGLAIAFGPGVAAEGFRFVAR